MLSLSVTSIFDINFCLYADAEPRRSTRRSHGTGSLLRTPPMEVKPLKLPVSESPATGISKLRMDDETPDSKSRKVTVVITNSVAA